MQFSGTQQPQTAGRPLQASLLKKTRTAEQVPGAEVHRRHPAGPGRDKSRTRGEGTTHGEGVGGREDERVQKSESLPGVFNLLTPPNVPTGTRAGQSGGGGEKSAGSPRAVARSQPGARSPGAVGTFPSRFRSPNSSGLVV